MNAEARSLSSRPTSQRVQCGPGVAADDRKGAAASRMTVRAARGANNSARVLGQSCPAATFSSSSFPFANLIGYGCASPDWLRGAAYTSFAHAEVEVNTSYSLPGRDGVSWPGLHDGLGGVTWAWASSPVQRHPVVLRQRAGRSGVRFF
ncbi:MAG: hypothetical protein AAFP03_17570, partial [Cyanobacteria bacterium J06598_3]